MHRIVETFLKENGPIKKPLLLGFSGGPDSFALAECLNELGVHFHAAHFDHGWRENSQREARQLQNWAREKKVPFYTARSAHSVKSELHAREERYAFFEKFFVSGAFQALILAHHKQDQCETILKRVLEGARLSRLGAMQPVSQRKDLLIWRPLLAVSKEEILSYNKEKGIQAFDDATNSDPKFLRARMRSAIFPSLSREFGKEISGPLLQIGKQSTLFSEYLDQKTKNRSAPISGPFGKMWDFSEMHPLEIEHIVCQNFSMSYSLRTQLISALIGGAANQKISYPKGAFMIDRQKLFYLTEDLPVFSQNIPLQDLDFSEGKWEWKIRISSKNADPTLSAWHSWWQGKISLALYGGKYRLIPASPRFLKRKNNLKIPAFMRNSLPSLAENGCPVADFFTGFSFGGLPPTPTLFATIQINPRR